jgi:catechol-2,3-dioxygenase
VNHIAFGVKDLDELEERKRHWLAHGCKVSEVVHEFITSIYTRDPDGNVVEFTCRTAASTKEDKKDAQALLTDDIPAVDPDYAGTVYFPDGHVLPVGVRRP